MLLIPALPRQRQVDLCEFKASLGYRASFRTARAVRKKKEEEEEEPKFINIQNLWFIFSQRSNPLEGRDLLCNLPRVGAYEGSFLKTSVNHA